MIDAEMYGMIPRANTERRESAPPENRSRKPKTPPPIALKNSDSATGSRHAAVRVPVELGPEVADMLPVVSGLTAEQSIVVDGAFHLDNERKLAELE